MVFPSASLLFLTLSVLPLLCRILIHVMFSSATLSSPTHQHHLPHAIIVFYAFSPPMMHPWLLCFIATPLLLCSCVGSSSVSSSPPDVLAHLLHRHLLLLVVSSSCQLICCIDVSFVSLSPPLPSAHLLPQRLL